MHTVRCNRGEHSRNELRLLQVMIEADPVDDLLIDLLKTCLVVIPLVVKLCHAAHITVVEAD